MRINEKSETRGITKKGRGTASRVEAPSGPGFVAHLAQIAAPSADYSGDLKRLKEEIDKVGDALEKEPTFGNFRAFKELLRTIANKVNAEAYRVELVGGGITGRAHEVITVIDKEADLLYHLVMREQKNHIRIAAQVVKIRGLVVDFLL